MLKKDQIHLKAVILCMLKMSKIHAACSVQNNVKDVEDIKTVGVSRGYTDHHQGPAIHMADSRIH